MSRDVINSRVTARVPEGRSSFPSGWGQFPTGYLGSGIISVIGRVGAGRSRKREESSEFWLLSKFRDDPRGIRGCGAEGSGDRSAERPGRRGFAWFFMRSRAHSVGRLRGPRSCVWGLLGGSFIAKWLRLKDLCHQSQLPSLRVCRASYSRDEAVL